MIRRRSQPESDSADGAPEWMVTFSDCMTLLLTFFVLLLSFSSFDEKVFLKLRIIFADALPGTSLAEKEVRDAFLPTPQVVHKPEQDTGSEKPTLEKPPDDNLEKKTEYVNFRKHKVFLFPSEKIFLGRGSAISSEGQSALADMAAFLKKMPGRIVISENGPGSNEYIQKLGLLRAWAILDYLVTSQGLDRKWFSISAATTLTQGSFENNQTGQATRGLEIVLLERSIYN